MSALPFLHSHGVFNFQYNLIGKDCNTTDQIKVNKQNKIIDKQPCHYIYGSLFNALLIRTYIRTSVLQSASTEHYKFTPVLIPILKCLKILYIVYYNNLIFKCATTLKTWPLLIKNLSSAEGEQLDDNANSLSRIYGRVNVSGRGMSNAQIEFGTRSATLFTYSFPFELVRQLVNEKSRTLCMNFVGLTVWKIVQKMCFNGWRQRQNVGFL